jgi:hypothetical protein
VQKQAVTDQGNCALVSSLPFLQKKLKELEQQTRRAGRRRVQVIAIVQGNRPSSRPS